MAGPVEPPFSTEFAAQIFPENVRQLCTWWAPPNIKRSLKLRTCPCETHQNGAPPLYVACLSRLSELSGETWDSHDRLLAWHLQAHYSAARAVHLAGGAQCPLEVSRCGRYAALPVCVFHRREPLYLLLLHNVHYTEEDNAKRRYWFFGGWHTHSSLTARLSKYEVEGITLNYAPVPQQSVTRSQFSLFDTSSPIHFDKNDPGYYHPNLAGVPGHAFEEAIRKSMRCARHRGPWLCWLARSKSVAYMTFFNAPEMKDGAHKQSYFLVFRPSVPGRLELVSIFDSEEAYAACRVMGTNLPSRYRPEENTEHDVFRESDDC